jgi:hypothetical protein
MSQVARDILYKHQPDTDHNAQHRCTDRFDRRVYIDILHGSDKFAAILSQFSQKGRATPELYLPFVFSAHLLRFPIFCRFSHN